MFEILAAIAGWKSIILLFLLASCGGVIAGYIHPASRPFMRKYGWFAFLIVVFLLGLFVAPFRQRQRGSDGGGPSDGLLPMPRLDGAIEVARDKVIEADLELSRRLIEAETPQRQAAERLADFEYAVEMARKEEDPEIRRARMIDLVERARRTQ